MLINSVLEHVQEVFYPFVNRSFIVKYIDNIIFFTICLSLLASVVCSSDTIGYFAVAGIFLTLLKIITTRGFKFVYSKFELCLIIYLAFVIISVAGSSLLLLSIKGILKTLMYFGYYITCTIYLQDHKRDVLKILGILILCISFETIVGLLQNSSHVAALAGWQDVTGLNPENVMTRVYGTLKPLNPNLFGGYMLSLLPVCYGITALFGLKNNKTFFYAGIAFSLLATMVMIMSGCRGVFAAFPVMILVPAIVLIMRIPQSFRNLLYKVYGIICALGVLIVFLSTSLRVRILSIFAFRGDSSTSFRFNVYQSVLQMLKDNPILGIGVGNQNFREIYGLYMKTGYDALSAYNIYLETAVESGIFALLAFIGYIYYLTKSALLTILTSKDVEKVIFITIALTSIIGILCHGFVDTVFFRPQIQFIFWIMTAIIRTFSRSV